MSEFKKPAGLGSLNTKIARPSAEEPAPARAEVAEAAPAPTPKPKQQTRAKAQPSKARGAAVAPGALPTRLSVSLFGAGDELAQARGAFLTDWTLGGEFDTFNGWIEGAIRAHAKLTPKQRAKIVERHAETEGTGKQASFWLATETAEAIRDAMADDQAAGEWHTRSTFARPAILEAVAQVKERSGGHLETPPKRLPNRLTR